MLPVGGGGATFNPSTQEQRLKGQEVKVILTYRLAWATWILPGRFDLEGSHVPRV